MNENILKKINPMKTYLLFIVCFVFLGCAGTPNYIYMPFEKSEIKKLADEENAKRKKKLEKLMILRLLM